MPRARPWRLAIAVLAVAEAGVALGFLAAVRWARSDRVAPEAAASIGVAPARRLTLNLSVVAFLVYGGIAAGTGTWAYTVLTEQGGVSGPVAGVAVAGYWAGFTASRLLLGVIARRISLEALPQATVLATVACLLVFWLAPNPAMRMTGLVLSGVAHGPFFPVQTLLTPRRFGSVRSPAVVGYQIAAATFGGALVPGTIGVLVAWRGLEVVRPALVAVAVGLVAITEALRRAAPNLPAVSGVPVSG